jgi:hypothetical protein
MTIPQPGLSVSFKPRSKRAMRIERTAEITNDPKSLDSICEAVADGVGILKWCRDRDIPFLAVHAWINDGGERQRAYELACAARGTSTVSQLEAIISRTIAGELDPRRAAVAEKGLKWLASVYDRRRYGEQTQVNVKHSLSDDHLAALRGMVDVRQPQSAAPISPVREALPPPIDAEFSIAPSLPTALANVQAPQPHDAGFYDV